MTRRAVAAMLRFIDRRCETNLYYAQTLARRVSVRVASGPRQLQVLAAGLLFGTRRWIRPITLRLDGPQGPIRFTIPDYSAFKVLDEVFYRGEYDIDLETPPASILDLGAHVGVSALFFRLRWPTARITAVEASPSLFRLLQANVRDLGVEVRHGAVTTHDGTTGFADSDRSWAGSLGEGIEVPAIALDTLLAAPTDLVKLDIEGGEFEALPEATHLTNAKVIVGEIHAEPGTGPAEEALATLRHFRVIAKGDGHGHTLFTARVHENATDLT